MKFENIKVYNFEGAFRGMRNPKNSWDKSDSQFGATNNYDELTTRVCDYCRLYNPDFVTVNSLSISEYEYMRKNVIIDFDMDHKIWTYAAIGPKDMKLAQQLISGGSEHRKFLRQIFVSVDITAPLYWYKEFDTYKIGTVANSTSTMHKITSKPITFESFDLDDYTDIGVHEYENNCEIGAATLIYYCEKLRQKYLELKDINPEEAKKYWKELIRWLPEGWLQTRTVTLNYENLAAIYHQRKNHKLTEWSDSFMNFIKGLPYSKELICYSEDKKNDN